MKVKASRESIKRQKYDRQRSLRVVKYIDYPFLLPDSPVELEEGYIVSDRDTCDVFASFVFKNISERPIKRLDVRLACYKNQNIPYLNIDFTYSNDDLTFGVISKNGVNYKLREANKKTFINKSESFGYCVFIPIPESYFTKMDVIISSVEYVNGNVEKLDIVVAGKTKRYHELDDISKLVYSRVNIYQSAEERYPTTVIPQFGSKVWMCCCGNKNPFGSEICEKCGREKAWQEKSVSAAALEETKQRMVSDPKEVSLHDKTKFKQNKFLENEQDVQKKIDQYEKAIKNIAYEEKRKDRRRLMLIPKLLLVVALIYVILFCINLFIEFKDKFNVEVGEVDQSNAFVSEMAPTAFLTEEFYSLI